jgi:hypothetical protein
MVAICSGVFGPTASWACGVAHDPDAVSAVRCPDMSSTHHGPASSRTPAYFVQVHWHEGRIALIRDFRYIPYIADGARFTR